MKKKIATTKINGITIESNVPLPDFRKGRMSPIGEVLASMEVGQSILIDSDKLPKGLNSFQVKKGKKFSSRTGLEATNKTRIWRVK